MTGNNILARIEELQGAYVHCIDDGRLEEWPDLFITDGVYKIISRDSHARGETTGIYYCESSDMMRDRVLALRETSIYESHHYRHILSAAHLTGENGGAHEAETSFVVYRIMRDGGTELFCSGKYVDRVVIDGDQARFAEKLVLTDSSRYDMMLAIPV